MSTHRTETVPTTWTTADEDFFRTTWDAFSAEFLAGAGVLLASYDDETVPLPVVVVSAAWEPLTAGAPAPAAK